MYLSDELIVRAITASVEVRAAPGVYGSKQDWAGKASVDAIKEYVEAQLSIAVSIKDVSFSAEYTGSRLERYDDHAEICLRYDLDNDMKRFCAIKELTHLLIDAPESMSPYGDQRIEDLVNSGLIGLTSGKSPTGEATQSEYLAEIAAIEILYPMERRTHDISELSEGQPFPIRRIALEREMPPRQVATSVNSDYLKYVSTAFDQVIKRNGEAE